MPVWIHRTTKQVLQSVASADLTEAEANYIEAPDLSAVAGQPRKYWIITGDVISLADAAAQLVIDADLLTALRDTVADEIERAESYTRAFALLVLDEFNDTALKINEILDAIDAATSLAEVKTNIGAIADRQSRTAAQLKTALRAKLNV